MDLVIDFIHDNIVTKYTSLQPHATHTEFACVYLAGLTTSWFFSVLVPAIDYALFYTQKSKRDQRIKKIMMEHTEGQVAREIAISLQASFGLALIYLLPFWGIHKGYSMLYKDVTAYPLWYIPISIIFFFGFTEFCVYWAHRLLHHPKLYAPLHKLHHTNSLWATPFAAFSFESVDSAFQGISYVCVPFVFPIQYHLLYGLLFLLMAWAASIHDRVHMTDVRLFNDAGHHFVHHRDFVYNYGQYFTFMDRICGTYKDPFAEEDKTKAQ